MTKRLLILTATTVVLGAPLLAACGGGNDESAGSGSVAITASDDACQVATTALKPGKTTFAVANKGDKITEVYVYGELSGKYTEIVAEVENVGPGTSRDLVADLTGGSYEIACKPGQAGDGIRTKVTVEGPKASATAAAKYDREIELEATDTTLENGDGLTAKAGEKIEFKLENKGTKKRNLEIIDPATKVIEEIEVEAGKDGEFIVALTTAGTWKLKVEGGDQEFEKAVIVG